MALLVDVVRFCMMDDCDGTAVIHCIECNVDLCIDCDDAKHAQLDTATSRVVTRLHTRHPILLVDGQSSRSAGAICHNDREALAVVGCPDCQMEFCLECDAIIHLAPHRSHHMREHLPVFDFKSKCTYCKLADATINCGECGDSYCEACDTTLHKNKKKRDHVRSKLLSRSDHRYARMGGSLPGVMSNLGSSQQSSIKCDNDLISDACVHCDACGANYCIECDAVLHLAEDAWDHARVAINPLDIRQTQSKGRSTSGKSVDSSIMCLAGHQGSQGALCCVVSYDNKYIISGGSDKCCRIWNATDGDEIGLFTKHEGWVLCVAQSHSGYKIVSTSRDETVRVWDMETRAEQLCLRPHGKRNALSVVFSLDDQRLLTASTDSTVKLFDTTTATPLASFTGHAGWATSAVFSPDGRVVASSSRDKTIKLWDARESRVAPVATVRVHKKDVCSVKFDGSGASIFSCSRDATSRLTDLRKPSSPIAVFEGHDSEIYSLDISSGDQFIASTSKDCTTRIWNVRDVVRGKTTVATILTGHTGPVYAASFFSDGSKRIATASGDKTVRSWSY